MPYQSKDELLLGQQLKVQELVIRFADSSLYSAAGSVVTVDFKEPLKSVACAEHCDDSGPSVLLVAQASIAISGNSAAITLASPFAAGDALVLKYTIQE